MIEVHCKEGEGPDTELFNNHDVVVVHRATNRNGQFSMIYCKSSDKPELREFVDVYTFDRGCKLHQKWDVTILCGLLITSTFETYFPLSS